MYKQRFTFLVPPIDDLYAILDAAKVTLFTLPLDLILIIATSLSLEVSYVKLPLAMENVTDISKPQVPPK